MSIPESLRLNNEKLDAMALLCDKSWVVFNDEGKMQEMIFQKSGRLIMSVDGAVSNFQWEYLRENRNILLTTDVSTTMLQPSFQDENILALKVSGQERYMFLIDRKQLGSFVAKTLSELQAYFDEKNKAISDAIAEKSVDKHIERAEAEKLKQSIRKELEANETFQKALDRQISSGKKERKTLVITGVVFLSVCLCLIGFEKRIFTVIAYGSFCMSVLFFVIAFLKYNPNQKEDIIKKMVLTIFEERIYDRGGW